MLRQLEGLLLIPHELLHIVGYRLVGKRCIYRWGDPCVTLAGPATRNERLIGVLFPFAVCMAAWFILLPAPFFALFTGGITWAIILTAVSVTPFFYAFTSIGDLRQAYLLIYEKKPRDKTPFDFLFWPILTDDPKRVQISALIVMICIIISYVVYLLLF